MKMKRIVRTLAVAAGIVWLSGLTMAQEPEDPAHGQEGTPLEGGFTWTSHRPDGHAPIGVMGDHRHHAGEWMLSVRHRQMRMQGKRKGGDSVSTAETLQSFMAAPTEMDMEMVMFGAMFAPTDDLTFMAMVPWIRKTMDHRTRMGTSFRTRSEGWGDTKLSGLLGIFEDEGHVAHLNLGLSIPTGSIDQRDATPAGPDSPLPYPMQLGSGTFDLLPGITYFGESEDWSWGGQAMATLRLDQNTNGYRLGDRLGVTAWGARRWTDAFSTSLRLAWETWGNIRSQDDRLNPRVVPTADPDRQAGRRTDLAIGMNLYGNEISDQLRGHRFAIELGVPIFQVLDGPQLETDWFLTFGWQVSF